MNAATPLLAATVVVPPSTPPPGLLASSDGHVAAEGCRHVAERVLGRDGQPEAAAGGQGAREVGLSPPVARLAPAVTLKAVVVVDVRPCPLAWSV